MWNYIHKIKELHAIDAQIWAWESGADKVEYEDENERLNLVITAKELGHRYLWAPKSVVTETHEEYKSFNFLFAPIHHISIGRTRGIIIQFKDDLEIPQFSIFPKKDWHPRVGNELVPLNFRDFTDDDPDHVVFEAREEDQWELYIFLRDLNYFNDITNHSKWHQFYAKDNFIAVYFKCNLMDDYALSKELSGLDEKIVQIVRTGSYQDDIDPAVNIQILKDEEEHQR